MLNFHSTRKIAGFNLTENSSGSRKGKTGISKRGCPGLRNLLYQASLALVSKTRNLRPCTGT
ncbi:transposase [Candidatus Desulforudis audaxviator]|uniref:transposase n=1 Tax=Candidatus Desulforudis audaxviator TaxID=471827 RepID=UPI0038BA89DE